MVADSLVVKLQEPYEDRSSACKWIVGGLLYAQRTTLVRLRNGAQSAMAWCKILRGLYLKEPRIEE